VTSVVKGLVGAITAVISICFIIAQISLSVLAVITIVEVASRYAFSSPTFWASDAVRYLMACVIIFGLPAVTLRQQHVSIDIVARQFSAVGLYNRGVSALCAVVSAVASVIFIRVFIGHIDSNSLTQGLWQIHRYWLSGALAFGFVVTTTAFLMIAFNPERKS
jgi:TRAP-type C4-dicarboxylate transport system permease small subunit